MLLDDVRAEHLVRQAQRIHFRHEPSEICVVGTATSKDNNSPFFYFVKAKICQVLEAPQMEYSLEGNGTYYFSKNLSAEAAMGFGRAFYAGNNSVFASFLLGVRYQFEN